MRRHLATAVTCGLLFARDAMHGPSMRLGLATGFPTSMMDRERRGSGGQTRRAAADAFGRLDDP